jgi:hypothetical protein
MKNNPRHMLGKNQNGNVVIVVLGKKQEREMQQQCSNSKESNGRNRIVGRHCHSKNKHYNDKKEESKQNGKLGSNVYCLQTPSTF